MPRRIFRKKAPRRRKGGMRRHGRKRGVNKRAQTLTLRSPTGIPDRIKTRLVYADSINVTSVLSVADQVFSGNSLFDPDFSGAGHQPLYFDQYSALYNKYRVYGAAISVDAINASGTASTSLIIVPDSFSTPLTSMGSVMEKERDKYPHILAVASRTSVRVKNYASTRAILGLTKPEMQADDIYAAPVTTDPASTWYWHILVSNNDFSSAINVHLNVKIIYYCEFFDRKPVGQS